MPSVAAMRLSEIVKPNKIPAANSIAVGTRRNLATDSLPGGTVEMT